MSFRESINNLLRGDRPESPTDLIFLFGGLIMIDLWVYATLAHILIPHLTEIIGFLILCKGVKVAADYTNKNATPTNVS